MKGVEVDIFNCILVTEILLISTESFSVDFLYFLQSNNKLLVYVYTHMDTYGLVSLGNKP